MVSMTVSPTAVVLVTVVELNGATCAPPRWATP
jgi:hypothetical protein